MNVGHMLQGNFINGEKLANAGPQEVTILSGEIANLGGEDKVIVSFEETDKQLALNKTRLSFMVGNFGEDTDNWVGQKVMLHSQKLTSGKFAGQFTILITRPVAKSDGPQTVEEIPF